MALCPDLEKPYIKSLLRGVPCAIGAVYLGVACLAHPSFRLAFFGDVAQLSMATALVAAFAFQAVTSEDRARWFWYLMTFGSLFWVASQTVWSYYELWRRTPSPDPSVGSVLLFLHLAPMIAALAVMPHKESGIPRLTALSLGMIFTWWLFLYAYLVVPWQYVQFSAAQYRRAFNGLYTIENLVFIGVLAVWAVQSRGAWRWLYVRLLAGSAVYAAGSWILDDVIDQSHYYTGSAYDLLFMLPIAWLAYVAASFRAPRAGYGSETQNESGRRVHGLTVVALLSVPFVLVWNTFSIVPSAVRDFRTTAGLAAMVVLALLLFAKQYVLTGRLSEALALAEYNVYELLQLREQLEVRVTHDAMTGLLNRSTVILSLERELARAERENQRVAALLLDLDHFKQVNDHYGHHAGDMAIAFAATCMEQCVRAHDYIGRYGGEEFLIVVPDCDEMMAYDIAERIRARMDEEVVSFDGRKIRVTATIGLALSHPGEASESLLRRADAALYTGKERGRNQVICAPELAMARNTA